MGKNKKNKVEYDLVKLTEDELIEARLNKDKVELDLMNAKGKLEIQNFKIKNDIAQLELEEDLEQIKEAIANIKKGKLELDKNDKKYNQKILRRDYDILCGKKRLELAKLKLSKRMGSRMSNEAIRVLVDQVQLCENNLKYFSDQIRTGKRKELKKEPEQIQLD